MTDNKEALEPLGSQLDAAQPQVDRAEKLRLYVEIISKEAKELLGRYLPEALPQEPTEVSVGVPPVHIGKFRGKHYIQVEDVPYIHTSLRQIGDTFKRRVEEIAKEFAEEQAWIRLLHEKFAVGEWTEETDLDELERQFFASRKHEPESVPEYIPDSDEPERLLKGRDQYSIETWKGIYSLVHELIHQRQAELNPGAFPPLSSPELNEVDITHTAKADLKRLLIEAHKSRGRTMDDNSLFFPVIEGMAVVGSFYVMGRLADDLIRSGQVEVAARVGQARTQAIHSELVQTERDRRGELPISYHLHYVEGSRMIRKIYKQFGIDTPKLLTRVDLQACQGITKGSTQYQQIAGNPALLPGLPEAA